MRISDWSSDVCSSDLHDRRAAAPEPASTPTVREEDQQNNGHDNYPEDRGGAHALFLLLCDDSRRLGVLRPRLALGKRELGDQRVGAGDDSRSEEHTSELPSLMRISYAVFCLKKK